MVSPALLLSSKEHVVPGQLLVTEYRFQVPLDHDQPDGKSIALFARAVNKHEKPINPLSPLEAFTARQKPWFVYLEGGPGFGNREPQDHALTRFVLSRGYQMLLLDYRGTGLSTAVTAETLLRAAGPNPQAQADYLKLFRQDSIVRDLEAVRLNLVDEYPPDKKAWTIFGQSFGGFVSFTYLSFFPEGLRDVFLTGGLAPLDSDARQVYTALYQKVIERNQAYYQKFPEDDESVRRIAKHLSSEPVTLPAGGSFTVERLLGLGLNFGQHGGLDGVHSLILRLRLDLDQLGFFTRPTLTALESSIPLDTNPIYAVLHEPLYCYEPGILSNWAAFECTQRLPEFRWLRELPEALASGRPLFFTGEMILPQFYDSYPELRLLKEPALILADFDGWPALYNLKILSENKVPVYAAGYVDDMYVDFELARRTCKLVRGIQVYETNNMYHNAVRMRTEEVLLQLFRMRDDVLD